MKSLIGLSANAGGAAAVWQRLPIFIKAPLVVGLVLLAVAELVTVGNQALRSGRITEGEAVKLDAQSTDPEKTRAAVLAGKPATGAERTIAGQVANLDADAKIKAAELEIKKAQAREATAKAKYAEIAAEAQRASNEALTRMFDEDKTDSRNAATREAAKAFKKWAGRARS
jgi:hypothetical protein